MIAECSVGETILLTIGIVAALVGLVTFCLLGAVMLYEAWSGMRGDR